jgi:hypothetical protein
MESLEFCAYNQTAQRFLGVDVIAAEFSDASFNDWMFTLTPGSGAGLWIVPFRGIPESAFRFPLDLIYLDEHCRVVDVVESFPASRVSKSSQSATSVLALPVRTISSSGTKRGDQLDIDLIEEMDRKLMRASDSAERVASKVQSPSSLRVPRNRELVGGPLSIKYSSTDASPELQPAIPATNPESKKSAIGRLMSWFTRRRSRDLRKAPREPSPRLTAHFWTGDVQEAHTIRDISSTGLYVVTKERWYLGTTIRVMLTKTDKEDLNSERSICVQSKAVRWGNDGVGMQFVLKDSLKLRPCKTASVDGADRKELDVFLKQLRNCRTGTGTRNAELAPV